MKTKEPSGGCHSNRVVKNRTSGPTATNKVHCVCFGCRKCFKQRGSSNWNPQGAIRPYVGPHCRRKMVRLGRYFKAPPQRNRKQWLKVELLYRQGELFE